MAHHYCLADIFVSARGSKSARLTTHDGLDVIHEPPCALTAPFGPSSFDKDPAATRMSFDIRCPEEAQDFFQNLDAWAVEYLAEHSERLFKKKLSPEQVAVGYVSCLKTKEGYEPLIRAKINTEGKKAICYWTPDGKERGPPESWRGVRMMLKLHVSHLWIMGTQFGLAINALDAQVLEQEEEDATAATRRSCPF